MCVCACVCVCVCARVGKFVNVASATVKRPVHPLYVEMSAVQISCVIITSIIFVICGLITCFFFFFLALFEFLRLT